MAPPVLHPASTTAYRRSARRLRARFSRQPALLQRALSDLAQSHDRNRHQPPPRAIRHVPAARSFSGLSPDPTTAAIERAFADHVATHLNGPILRYSDRLEMLKTADRLHIHRFQANLIIALVQHEAMGLSVISSSASHETPAALRRRGSLVSTVVMILLMELAMAGAAIWVWHA